MAFKFLIAVSLVSVATAAPANTLQDLLTSEDALSIGSFIRETRAAPPEDYHKSYNDEGDGEIGYRRKKAGGGKKGYQHFDSYHKKAGDNYEFEKQDSFGQDNGGSDKAHGDHHEEKARYTAPASEAEEYEEFDSEEKEKKQEIKQLAPNGNGGLEAEGHDSADYKLPQKYIYGSGDEYNF